MIGLVLPTHTHDPARLMESVIESGEPARWYIFHHSQNARLEEKLEDFALNHDVKLYLYRANRGLAKSWNEGINKSFADNCELTLVLNDDLHFRSGGFKAFVDHLRKNETFSLGFLNGLEIGGHLDGKIIVQGMACFAISRLCIDKIGYFDETFVPAYYEDIDYLRRMRLAGLEQTILDDVIAEHHRSSTTKSNPEIAELLKQTHERNRLYYERKWGGPQGQETFTVPFGRSDIGLKIGWEDRDRKLESLERGSGR